MTATSTHLRVLVIGAGSIGTRHARNLLALGCEVAVSDPDPGRASTLPGTRPVAEDADPSAYDAVVVASPTVHHGEHLAKALAGCPHVFVEKPLATAPDEVADLVATSADRVMVGYNLRLHEPVRRVVELARDGAAGEIRLARFWFGSHLPDWRPGVDYRESYSARRSLGGGVLLDAIHELDLVVWLFGPGVEVAESVVTRIGGLDIDVEDTVRALLRSKEAVIEVALDYLSRRYRRGIELIGDEATLRLDWARKVIEIETAEDLEVIEAGTDLARSYEIEARRLVDWVTLGTPPPVGGMEGLASLDLAQRIRDRA